MIPKILNPYEGVSRRSILLIDVIFTTPRSQISAMVNMLKRPLFWLLIGPQIIQCMLIFCGSPLLAHSWSLLRARKARGGAELQPASPSVIAGRAAPGSHSQLKLLPARSPIWARCFPLHCSPFLQNPYSSACAEQQQPVAGISAAPS